MRVLGIETSCDETAAAVVEGDARGSIPEGRILSSVVLSQKDHAAFGGVVPEIAARAHASALDQTVVAALRQANLSFEGFDAVAVTAGPGLIGGLMVGMCGAKALAWSQDIPFIGVNHLEGHALTPRLTDGLRFPYLFLLVSGGHSQLLVVKDLGSYERLGSTIDDALGEAFDKTAKLLQLGYPGGPAVEAAAMSGDPQRFAFPRPLFRQPVPNFSFSGLKTAVRQQAEELAQTAPLTQQDVSDICASFQFTVAEVLKDRVRKAYEQIHNASRKSVQAKETLPLVVAGGVAANSVLRAALTEVADELGTRLIAAPLELCGDNAAMIAWAGLERLQRGERSALDMPARARWPLDENAATLIGHGKAGAKV